MRVAFVGTAPRRDKIWPFGISVQGLGCRFASFAAASGGFSKPVEADAPGLLIPEQALETLAGKVRLSDSKLSESAHDGSSRSCLPRGVQQRQQVQLEGEVTHA